MAKYEVTMNGTHYAYFEYPTAEQAKFYAENFVACQRGKIAGAGVLAPGQKVDPQKLSYAANQKWDVIAR